jgi:hypothetical protein
VAHFGLGADALCLEKAMTERRAGGCSSHQPEFKSRRGSLVRRNLDLMMFAMPDDALPVGSALARTVQNLRIFVQISRRCGIRCPRGGKAPFGTSAIACP